MGRKIEIHKEERLNQKFTAENIQGDPNPEVNKKIVRFVSPIRALLVHMESDNLVKDLTFKNGCFATDDPDEIKYLRQCTKNGQVLFENAMPADVIKRIKEREKWMKTSDELYESGDIFTEFNIQ